jgi:DNA-binding GntR family transcriptional regulator
LKGNSTSVKKISKYLREKITRNILKSGNHLCEKKLADEFGVSRVPVRESLRILQSEGYLEFIPNKGCYVKKVSPEFVNQTTLVYILIAPVVLEKAIPNYTEKTYKKAENIIEKIEKSENNQDIGYLLCEFATVIYTPSRMKFMVRVFDLIYQQSVRLLNEFFENEKNAEFKVDAHRKFIELCKQNKTKEAIKYWSDFLSALEKLVNPK